MSLTGTAPTTSSPSLSEIASQASRLPGTSPDVTRLTVPWAVASASVGASAREGRQADHPFARQRAHAPRRAAPRPRARGHRRSAGRPAGRARTRGRCGPATSRRRPRRVPSPGSTLPRRRAWPGAHRARVAGRSSAPVRASSRCRTAAPSRGCRRSRAAPPHRARPAPVIDVPPADSSRRCGAGCRTSRRPRRARRRRARAAVPGRRAAPRARRSPRRAAALGLELDAGELGEAAQPQLEDVVGLQRAEVEDSHQPGAGLRRCRRWCG